MIESIKKYHSSITIILLLVIVYLLMVLLFAEREVVVKEPEIVTHTKVVYVYVTNNDIKEPETTSVKAEDRPKEKQIAKTTRSATRTPQEQTKEFEITAYDNTVQSQGKWVDKTATGFNLKGHTLESAKCIAVDPNVIPLGSKVQLYFGEEYKHLNGVYIARDTGGAIKGNKIDLFMGDGPVRKEVMEFGRRKVQVKIIE